MLKKLKHKIVLINMALVGMTVILIFFAVCAMTYRSQLEEIYLTLEQVSQRHSRFENAGGMTHPSSVPQIGGDEPIPFVAVMSVTVSEDGTVIGSREYGTGMDDELLRKAVNSVLADVKESDGRERLEGTLSSLGLIYMTRPSPEGRSISFASDEPLRVTLRNTAAVAGIACAFGMLIFFFISRFLAGIAIRPAEEAWRSQKQFIADASHDIKTPLTVILANNGILRSHADETVSSQLKWLESTEEEARHMKALADKLVELSSSEMLTESCELCVLPVSDITQKQVLQFEPVAYDAGVDIRSEIDGGICIPCNESAYIRLLHILLDNAIKYCPSGAEISVRLHPLKGSIALEVANHGRLIPAEDLPHIFERFYRADRARSVGGHGLGLAIAKNLTEALGAKISVTSDEQAGTVFTVMFKE